MISVNLDTDRDKWLNIMGKDSLYNFIDVSDLQDMKSDVVTKYGIGGLPMMYLIDGNGIVLAGGAEIMDKLEEIAIKEK